MPTTPPDTARPGRKRATPPEGWHAPDGRCACGCGQPTPVALISRRERDQYAGYPLRFINGHNTRGLSGAAASGWKGGRHVHKSGYIYVRAIDHPHANRDGYVLEHRLIYERVHGVLLAAIDVIHHVNGSRGDNRPENLVRTTRALHATVDPAIRTAFDDWRGHRRRTDAPTPARGRREGRLEALGEAAADVVSL